MCTSTLHPTPPKPFNAQPRNRIPGVTVSKAMILKKLDKADKATFEAELLNDKVKTFMVEEVCPLEIPPKKYPKPTTI